MINEIILDGGIAHLTVATLLNREFPIEIENALVLYLKQQHSGWKVGLPKERWGLHPDILFRTGLTGDLREGIGQEFYLDSGMIITAKPYEEVAKLLRYNHDSSYIQLNIKVNEINELKEKIQERRNNSFKELVNEIKNLYNIFNDHCNKCVKEFRVICRVH